MSYPENERQSALDHAVLTTLELMAFAEIAPATDAAPDAEADFVWAAVDIAEPIIGKVLLYTRRGTAEEIARLIHGCDDGDLDPELLFDAMGELANTVGGRCLASLIAETETFRLRLPQTGAGMPAPVGTVRAYIDPEEEWVLGAALELSAPD